MTKNKRNVRILASTLVVWGAAALIGWSTVFAIEALFDYASVAGFYRGVASVLLLTSVGTIVISAGVILTFHASLNLHRAYLTAQRHR